MQTQGEERRYQSGYFISSSEKADEQDYGKLVLLAHAFQHSKDMGRLHFS